VEALDHIYPIAFLMFYSLYFAFSFIIKTLDNQQTNIIYGETCTSCAASCAVNLGWDGALPFRVICAHVAKSVIGYTYGGRVDRPVLVVVGGAVATVEHATNRVRGLR
jgi:hypothetical protein